MTIKLNKLIQLKELSYFKRKAIDLSARRHEIGLKYKKILNTKKSLNDSIDKKFESIKENKNNKYNLIQNRALKSTLIYLNHYRQDSYGKDSENVSLGLMLLYITDRIKVGLDEDHLGLSITRKTKKKFKSFIDCYNVIIKSLLFTSNDYIKFTQTLSGTKSSKQTERLNSVYSQSQTILPIDVVNILSSLLHNTLKTLSSNILNVYELTEAEVSRIVNRRFTILKKTFGNLLSKEFNVPKLKRELSKLIKDLVYNYNKLNEEVLSLNIDHRGYIIPQFITLLYCNRGVNTGERMNPEILEDVCKTIHAEELQDVGSEEIGKFLPDLEEISRKLGSEFSNREEINFPKQKFDKSDFLFVSGKSGPNGQSSILNMPFDCQAILDDAPLFKSIVELGSKFGIEIDRETLESISSVPVPNLNYDPDINGSKKFRELEDGPVHSKIFTFIEQGGKRRVVAEVDALTQTVLKPIHRILSDISRNIGMSSGQFIQDDCFMEQSKNSIENKFIGTYDLRAVTDLLSVKLQSIILDYIFSEIIGEDDIGGLWMDVISRKREFLLFDSREKEKIKYKIGQPMGALSSWVAMHITMLVIMMQARKNLVDKGEIVDGELHTFCAVTGDDLSISDPSMYDEVGRIMKGLKLQINEDKSFVSDQTEVEKPEDIRLFGEFLKKFVLDSGIFIPFSPRRGSKFFVAPRSMIWSFIFLSYSINIPTDPEDLIKYAVFKDIDSDIDGKVVKESSVSDFSERYSHISEQLFFFLFGDRRIGGCELDFEIIYKAIGTDNNPVWTYLFIQYPIDNLSNEVFSKILNNKINSILASSHRRADKAILSVFSSSSLKIFKALKTDRPETYQDLLSPLIDEGDLSILENGEVRGLDNNYRNPQIEEAFESHPIYRQIIKILFKQKLDIENKSKEIRDKLLSLGIRDDSKRITDDTLQELESILYESKRELNPVDFDSLIRVIEQEEVMFPSVISLKMIKSIKSLLNNRRIIRDYDIRDVLKDNPLVVSDNLSEILK